MRLLVENGADLNAVNTYKNTALISAINEGNYNKNCKNLCEEALKLFFSGYDKIAELLIQMSANVNMLGNHRNTALILAAEKGNFKFRIIQLICFVYPIIHI